MKDSLAKLLQRPDIWQASGLEHRHPLTLPSGIEAFDQQLHQGGWPGDAISEILSPGAGVGEMTLLRQPLSHIANQGLPIFIVSPPCMPFAKRFAQAGIAPERLIVIKPGSRQEVLWSLEQIVRSGCAGGVLGWLPEVQQEYADIRRLQLAAHEQQSAVFLFRPEQAENQRSPAALRLKLTPKPGCFDLEILKQRGGWAGQRIDIPRNHPAGLHRVPAALLPTVTRASDVVLSGPPLTPRAPESGSPLQQERMH